MQLVVTIDRSIVNFGPIWNPTTKSSGRSRSKFDRFRSIYKYWFSDWKSWLKDQKSQFISKKLINFNHFWLQLIKNWFFNLFFTCWNRFCRDNSDSNYDFGSKKSIKRRFKSDIEWYLAWARLDQISLVVTDKSSHDYRYNSLLKTNL